MLRRCCIKMTTWQEDLKEDRKLMRELHEYSFNIMTHHEYLVGRAVERLERMRRLINQFDRASEDKTKLEIAGRLVSLIQKVML